MVVDAGNPAPERCRAKGHDAVFRQYLAIERTRKERNIIERAAYRAVRTGRRTWLLPAGRSDGWPPLVLAREVRASQSKPPPRVDFIPVAVEQTSAGIGRCPA